MIEVIITIKIIVVDQGGTLNGLSITFSILELLSSNCYSDLPVVFVLAFNHLSLYVDKVWLGLGISFLVMMLLFYLIIRFRVHWVDRQQHRLNRLDEMVIVLIGTLTNQGTKQYN